MTLYVGSCTLNNSPKNSSSDQIWSEGISTLTGTIKKVNPEKDGQTLILITNNQVESELIVSIANLGENKNQYRIFEVGEYLTFKGNLLENGIFIVREILETQ